MIYNCIDYSQTRVAGSGSNMQLRVRSHGVFEQGVETQPLNLKLVSDIYIAYSYIIVYNNNCIHQRTNI